VPEAKAVELFFSFIYDGKPSAELLKTWELKRSSQKLDDHRTRHTLTYTDPKTKLELRCVGVEYNDYPTVEWTLYFKNAGNKDTPILSDIQALDIQIERPAGASSEQTEFRLHHAVGSPCLPKDYQPLLTTLGPGVDKRIGGAGGRPTCSDMSYFNLEWPGHEGMIIAVGWPGQWASSFTRDKENHLRIRAGQELTHFKLLPGEEVRSPLIALQFWKGGDWLRAQNVWRRWFIAHNIRRPGGKLPPTQWCGATEAGKGACMEFVTEKNSKERIDDYERLGLKPDFWWMDAGWYPWKEGWFSTGTWEVDKTRFPNGIRAVTDYLHARGIRSLLWFEPERVVPDTWLFKNRREWILDGEKNWLATPGASWLVNLGNPDAWKWTLDFIDKTIIEEGIDIFRQDFNMDPLSNWRANDAKDRQGITEIRHVTGLLALWDELLRRHPGMLFDNCASGGRRNDLESMRRGVPYTKSDYALEPVGVQCETYGISMWLPYYAATWMYTEDAYVCRSNMAHVTGAVLPANGDKNYGKQLPKRLDEWQKTVANYWGDFWPLTPYSLENNVWIAWQFDRPEQGEGVVQVFRRAESDYEAARFRLRGLEPGAVYTLTNLDVEGSTEKTGKELLDSGLPVAIKDRPNATIITYKKK
jgi:alpha-galactosidase